MNVSIAQWTAAFDMLLRCTLQAGVLVLLILVLRRVLAGRLQERWLFALWFVLLIRLALPWSPASSLSLYGIVPGLRAPAAQTSTLAARPLPDLPASSLAKDPGSSASPVTDNLPLLRQDRAPTAHSSWDIKRIVYTIWLAGVLVLASILVAVNIAFHGTIRGEPVVVDEHILRLLEECKARMGVQTVLGLVSSKHVKSPSLYGFVRPRLLLPSDLLQRLSHGELRHIFLHELAHLKRHDVLIGWLMSLLQVVHWPNPLVWLGLHQMRLDRELACDSLALSALGADTPRDYGRTLLHVFECFRQRQYLPALAGLVDNPSQLQRRITMIAQSHAASRKSTLWGVGLVLALAIVTLTDSAKVIAKDQQQDAVGSSTSASTGTTTFSPKASYTIYPGKGLDIIHVGDSAKQIEAGFGKAPAIVNAGDTCGFDYRKTIGIDFLLDKNVDKIIEIRFNEGFKGTLADGTRLGDSLDTVLAKSGGAKKTVEAKKNQADGCVMGDDRVLYKTSAYGVVPGYKFIDAAKGVLYWFGPSKKLTQIVVFHPDENANSGDVEPRKNADKDKNGDVAKRGDESFEDDARVVGEWESVDLVQKIEQFNPEAPRTKKQDFHLLGLVLQEGGKINWPWMRWTKGALIHFRNIAFKYVIKDVSGTDYMFLEWKWGDSWFEKPVYYVLRKLPAGSKRFQYPGQALAMEADEVELPADSHVDADGKIVDSIDRPFVDDPDVIGQWKSVDFVYKMDEFKPGSQKWKGDLFLKDIVFLKDGKTRQPWATWTKGYMLMSNGDGHTAPRYTIKDIDGSKYMFFEWKSGDYTYGHRKPYYYVLKKVDAN